MKQLNSNSSSKNIEYESFENFIWENTSNLRVLGILWATSDDLLFVNFKN